MTRRNNNATQLESHGKKFSSKDITNEEAKHLRELVETFISSHVSCVKQFVLVASALSALLILQDLPSGRDIPRIVELAFRTTSCLLLVSTCLFLYALYLYLPVLRRGEIEAYMHSLQDSADRCQLKKADKPTIPKAERYERLGYTTFGITMLLLLLISLALVFC